MNEEDAKAQGAEIAAARKAAGLSKEAAAKRAGVTTTTLRRAEAGQRVQSHKLAAIMTAVGMPAFATPPRAVEDDEVPFALPAGIERGYVATVAFTKAVAAEVPELSHEATRLMLDAASLFAAAGNAVFDRTPEGGDGNAEDPAGRRSAPIGAEVSEAVDRDDFALAADEQGEIAGEQESHNEP